MPDVDPKDVEHLVYEGLEALSTGGSEALEALLAQHPEHAPRVRARLARLERLGLAGTEPAAGGANTPEQLGEFRLLRRIGEGGMGLVWEAEDTTLGRRVALKMVRPEQLWFPGARERFRREVAAVARLQHPGIVPVHSVGEEGGVPFFAMELLDGCTLGDVLRVLRGRDPARLTGRDLASAIEQASPRRDELPSLPRGALFEGSWIEACMQITRQVAEALDHAHGRGLVHRDVKPSNIAITRTGRAMLLDFGLARSDSADRLTRSGSQPGSLPYMSPEQLDARGELDLRTDVYSLGVSLFELLTLAPAFDGASAEGLRQSIRLGAHARPRERNPSLAWDVETVCLTAFAREPARRYASADDFARDLGNLLAHRPIEARRAGALLRVVRWTQRHPRASAALVAAIPLALVALGGIAWIEQQGRIHESDLRAEANASAALAQQEKHTVLRLSDGRRLSDLESEADALWPAVPARIDDYRHWLERAAELVGRGETHRGDLDAFERGAGAVRTPEGSWRFSSTEEQWHHDTLASLIAGLERIAQPETGLIARVRERLAFATTVEEATRGGAEARARWDDAARSIADPAQCPAYRGLALKPQLGLLPIGRNPDSGLWEFAHLQTGLAAERAADGRLLLASEHGLVFVLVPGGRFRMGSVLDPSDPDFDPMAEEHEAPAHEVVLEPFFLSKYPMTHEAWERFTGRNPIPEGDEIRQPKHPVVYVNWADVTRTLDQLGLVLPTEAQWEYACRAGTTTPWWTGKEKESLQGAANLLDATVARTTNIAGRPYEAWLDDGYGYTSPVDAFRANPFGLHDMTGNVGQWIREGWVGYEQPARPGDGERAGASTKQRMFRGASASHSAHYARSANREGMGPELRHWTLGVRPSRAIEL